MKAKNSGKENQYREFQTLDLPSLDSEVLEFWKQDRTFERSTEERPDAPPYVFYEGPPSANAMPGIHHAMARAIKDIFCRYHTQKGYRVERKAGWDTHGLPIELAVEKRLGITKKDIGTKISVEEYNQHCREQVMQYKKDWDNLTLRVGYWVDLSDPYITFDKQYIESVWNLLKRLHEKDFLYKGYTIQPYSPAAGTQLSSHELNQPGAYRDVSDTTVTALFKRKDAENQYFLAWTTTPWTLPSNTALAVGEQIDYCRIDTFNQYTGDRIEVWLAKELIGKYFNADLENGDFDAYSTGDKKLPWKVLETVKGKELVGARFEQLMPYVQPEGGDPFRVIPGDYVTTEDGTGIVHIAPTFGADDKRVAEENNIPPLLFKKEIDGNPVYEPLVDKEGKFQNFNDQGDGIANYFVKNYKDQEDYESVDIKIAVILKKTGRAFKVEKYNHSYPHCWRTDKPVIYYPLESWFIRTTAAQDRMIELNNTINWKPKSTGEGRFGKWLENMVDWNLSRSRFWGTPLPVWRTEDGTEEKCIGSYEELRKESEKAVEAGLMDAPLSEEFDPHKPYVDQITLVSDSGKPMKREDDLIDVWFDSGAMPYAQWHFPFENEEKFKANYPADFIAEGVDQTRGWFYTLHAIATMLFDSVAYKNVVSNGLVLDKNGVKMSKRLGNAVNPFETIDKYGADATRWYMISNAQPWDNLKFDLEGIQEVQRKFFGTLYNTYSFFALYANVDGWTYSEADIDISKRSELDRWILSQLHSLIKEVDGFYADYEPTRACRAIQDFVDRHLSNWFVRLSRRRFWKGEMNEDKQAAYQTLYHCLETVLQLSAPVAPFFSEFFFGELNRVTGKDKTGSVHLAEFPKVNEAWIDEDLEERMRLAQDYSSMVLSLRKKERIKVRQPLNKVLIPVLNDRIKKQLEQVEDLIKSEVNVKEVEYVSDTSGIIVKSVKPDFKVLGKRLGPKMKQANQVISGFEAAQIAELEREGGIDIELDGENFRIGIDEVNITAEDIPGWLVANEGNLTVALDITLTDELVDEGHAREIVNRIQNMRKDLDFNVTDRIRVELSGDRQLEGALHRFKDYICTEILADSLNWSESLTDGEQLDINDLKLSVRIEQKS